MVRKHLPASGSKEFDIDEEHDIEDYEMLSTEFDFEVIRQSPAFGVKQYADSIYWGELQDRKREGKGVIVYFTGRVYEGDWFHDKREGKGFELYLSGNTY